MQVSVVRIAFVLLLGAATWGAGFPPAASAQASSSTSTSGDVGPVTDSCFEQYVHHVKICKQKFCPNVLYDCDQQAYKDCRGS